MTQKLKLGDLEISFIKGSGPGGQNRNKRFTGVRLRDPRSGLEGVATERRSQSQNLKKALERLQEKIDKQNQRPIPRKKTYPSNASQKRRVLDKKARGEIKKLRINKNGEW